MRSDIDMACLEVYSTDPFDLHLNLLRVDPSIPDNLVDPLGLPDGHALVATDVKHKLKHLWLVHFIWSINWSVYRMLILAVCKTLTKKLS
jgi:hypothetical protein